MKNVVEKMLRSRQKRSSRIPRKSPPLETTTVQPSEGSRNLFLGVNGSSIVQLGWATPLNWARLMRWGWNPTYRSMVSSLGYQLGQSTGGSMCVYVSECVVERWDIKRSALQSIKKHKEFAHYKEGGAEQSDVSSLYCLLRPGRCTAHPTPHPPLSVLVVLQLRRSRSQHPGPMSPPKATKISPFRDAWEP